ncbi:MAG: hypothetical protein JWR24_2862 [Actinoallomurus sp.]|jgi:hypothetical protein|nr:hypothetical protein [Actinoallomurus sp.]
MTTPGRATKEKTASTKTTASSRATGQRGRQTRAGGRATAEEEHAATVPVPVVTPHVKVYKLRLPMPGMSYVGDAGHAVAGYLPSPDRLAFYGGLGLAAALGVLDWPVAAAIGIGTMIARRANRDRDRESAARASRPPQQARATARS